MNKKTQNTAKKQAATSVRIKELPIKKDVKGGVRFIQASGTIFKATEPSTRRTHMSKNSKNTKIEVKDLNARKDIKGGFRGRAHSKKHLE